MKKSGSNSQDISKSNRSSVIIMLIWVMFICSSAIMCGLMLSACKSRATKNLTIINDAAVSGPVSHGLSKLKETLLDRNFQVNEISTMEETPGTIKVIIGAGNKDGLAAREISSIGIPLPEGPESIVIRKSENKVIVYGSDSVGLMYALLDIARQVNFMGEDDDFISAVNEITQTPEIVDRGVSMFTMQRSYFEQKLYSEDYWSQYFDMLARSRFNSFVVIFGYENGGFMAPLYPYFFTTDGFPDIVFTNLNSQQQLKNRNAFNRMIEIAHEHGIRVIAGIWDHIYRGGVQSGGIINKMDVSQTPQEHMVSGVNQDNLYEYTKTSVKQFLEVFPEIDGLQFRMHNESGLKNDEMEGFWHEIFEMIAQTHPELSVDLRAKELPDVIINDALDQRLNVRVTTKYWMEQMGMPFHPTHINIQNQHDRRHGYADLLSYPQRYKVHWRLWNEGTSRILLWGDPNYVRRFLESTRIYDGNSFEVNEPLATKMETQPHDAEPFELLNPDYRYYEYEFERYWYFYELFGRLGYNPNLPDDHWEPAYNQRFGPEGGPLLIKGMQLASQVLPRIITACNPYQFFPATRGWVEKMHMGDLPFYSTAEGSDIQQFANYKEYAQNHLSGIDDPKRSPIETGEWFINTSSSILDQVNKAESISGQENNKEFFSTITDLKILAYLAKYHGIRMVAAVHYNAYLLTHNLWSLEDAINKEKEAIEAWEQIVLAAGDVYHDDLMMGICRLNMCGSWKDDLEQLQDSWLVLDSMRQNYGKNGENDQPAISHWPVRRLHPADKLVIRATATGMGQNTVAQCMVKDQNGNFIPHPMTRKGDYLFESQISIDETQNEFQYYIRVADESGLNINWPRNASSEAIKVIVTDDSNPPNAALDEISTTTPGEPLKVSTAINDNAGIKWVRLRYRHLTQMEDYQSIEMNYNEGSGKYEGTIPGEFITPEWDLMYLIECMDIHGNGRMYPDLEKEMPYVIVKVDRN